MTGVSKFLLTGLGGVGVITATGYGVYYDENNKKKEKSKKNEDVKTKSQDENADASKLEKGKEKTELKKEEKQEQQKSSTKEEVQPKVNKKLEESGDSSVPSTESQDVSDTNHDSADVQIQQNQASTQPFEGQEDSAQVGNNDGKLSQQQTAISNTGSGTDIQKPESSSAEEDTKFKLSETSSETEAKEISEDGSIEKINSNSGDDGQGSPNSEIDIKRDDSVNGKGAD